MTNAIEARGLVKKYGEVQALDGLSLSVPEGVVFGLLGPNGAGKSTTVKILTTLSRADEGRARVGGHDVVDEAEKVRYLIGVVAQKSGLDPEATGRVCCSWTSPPPGSTPRCAPACGRRSRASRGRRGSRSSSRRITWRRPTCWRRG